MSLDTSAVVDEDYETISNFFLTAKDGNAAAAAAVVREVYTRLNPDGDTFSPHKKKARIEPPVEAPLDFSYHFGDEIDDKQSTIVMKVPNIPHIVGHIIGKGGSSISNFQNASGAKVQIEKTENKAQSTVDVNITGTVKQNNIACSMVAQSLASFLGSRDQGEDPTATSLTILVPNDSVRRIIGKSGSSVQEIQKASGAHIQFEQESQMLPTAIGRTVTIARSGLQQRCHAEYLVHRRVVEDSNYSVSWAAAKRGQMGVASALPANLSSMTQQYGGSSMGSYDSNAGFNSFNSPADLLYMQQLQMQQQQQQFMMQQQQQQQEQQPATQPLSQTPGLGSFGLQGGMGGMPSMPGISNETQEFTIPNNLVSRIIGKGGQGIREIQTSTGAHVQIQKEHEMAPGSIERKVTVSGSPQGVALAKTQILTQVQQFQQLTL